MIEAMSTGDYRRLAPRGNGSVEPLLRHQRRRARQRGVLLAALATASIGGLVVAAAGTAIAPAVAGSVAAVLLTVWLRLLKLQPDAAPDTEQPAPARQRVSN